MDRERSLERLDSEQANSHRLDRIAPSRRAAWPKDDRRSSAKLDDRGHVLTDAERESRWPIG
jgi:hypothetical protein